MKTAVIKAFSGTHARHYRSTTEGKANDPSYAPREHRHQGGHAHRHRRRRCGPEEVVRRPTMKTIRTSNRVKTAVVAVQAVAAVSALVLTVAAPLKWG